VLIQRTALRKLTTLGIGGESEVWVVSSAPELAEATREGYRVLGGGSNLLVSDEGVRERVIRLAGELGSGSLEGGTLRSGRYLSPWLGAGRSLPGLLRQARTLGLSGLEGLVGIPATLGGAVWMNAGTRFGEIFTALDQIEIWRDGRAEVLEAREVPWSYRSSGLPRGAVVTKVRLQLQPSDEAEVARRMQPAHLARQGQPKARTAGCAFKNPPGESAGRLIDRAGLKGLRIGDAMISREHGNFIVNVGQASSEDVLRLLDQVRGCLPTPLDLELEVWP
jgi:UDP-N-acetylmuramate dehydrogenase